MARSDAGQRERHLDHARRPTGETLCKITLSAGNNRQENGRIAPSPDCPAAVAKLELVSWQLSAFDLTLMSGNGTTLAFAMTADGNFEKAREGGGKPLLLVRN